MDKLERWEDFVPRQEMAANRKAGYGGRIGIGERPALLNIDTTYMFTDPEYALCGAEMPELIKTVVKVTETFRRLGLPIYYSRRDDRRHPTRRGVRMANLRASQGRQYTHDKRADEWPEAYAPREEDIIILKNKASSFFGTPLEAFLRHDRIDTLIVVGISTSGCVRAAVSDAYAHNFRPIVIEDGVGDRSPQAHRANLFDMDMKYADVDPSEKVLAELEARFGAAGTPS
jgi:nicotinamidase-related amidase